MLMIEPSAACDHAPADISGELEHAGEVEVNRSLPPVIPQRDRR
jgi:hypothetical protein